MSSEPTVPDPKPSPVPDATHRQRFGLVLAVVLGLIAAAISYAGTRDVWVVADRRPDPEAVSTPVVPTDPAGDIELPDGPHRDEFHTSCLICHSARLPFGQPPFGREKWAEVVHKMAVVYGAPIATQDEAHVVDYLLSVRPPTP